MTWNLSTGAQRQLGIGAVSAPVFVIGNTFTFTTDAIQDSANGLGSFKVGDFITIIGPDNGNIEAKVLTAAAGELTFKANSFTDAAAGNYTCIAKFKSGSFRDTFKNGFIRLFTGARPSDADEAETGTLLVTLSLNSGTITAGESTNGLNVGVIGPNNEVKRAIDPATGAIEKWTGDGVEAGTAGWGRWYDNNLSTGASTTAVRMDGIVTTSSGSDIVMSNGRDVAVGAPVSVTDVNVSISG